MDVEDVVVLVLVVVVERDVAATRSDWDAVVLVLDRIRCDHGIDVDVDDGVVVVVKEEEEETEDDTTTTLGTRCSVMENASQNTNDDTADANVGIS